MFILAFVNMSVYAQSLTVTGKVVDSEGYEVIGSSVTVKGAVGIGTVTDINGNYTLKVNDASKDVLVFSYVGMTSQEVKVNMRSVINVTLKADAVMLDEVVAIGYATVKRKDLTGSVASVNSKELSKVPTADITQALAGRMAGVQVMQTEGSPGASISIRVRGGISITQSNEPLYIIDGFPSEDGMSTLDPAEIETIDILKDASATAIYGARGADRKSTRLNSSHANISYAVFCLKTKNRSDSVLISTMPNLPKGAQIRSPHARTALTTTSRVPTSA